MEYKTAKLDQAVKDTINSVKYPEKPFDILYKSGQVFSLGND
jgi:hypothetical protein